RSIRIISSGSIEGRPMPLYKGARSRLTCSRSTNLSIDRNRWSAALMLFERELVEQRGLLDLPMSHHDLQSTDTSASQQPLFSTESAKTRPVGVPDLEPGATEKDQEDHVERDRPEADSCTAMRRA